MHPSCVPYVQNQKIPGGACMLSQINDQSTFNKYKKQLNKLKK